MVKKVEINDNMDVPQAFNYGNEGQD